MIEIDMTTQMMTTTLKGKTVMTVDDILEEIRLIMPQEVTKMQREET